MIYEWPVFPLLEFMAILYWLAYVMNSKKSNRMSTKGVGIIVMVRKLKKIINPPRFFNSMSSPSF